MALHNTKKQKWFFVCLLLCVCQILSFTFYADHAFTPSEHKTLSAPHSLEAFDGGAVGAITLNDHDMHDGHHCHSHGGCVIAIFVVGVGFSYALLLVFQRYYSLDFRFSSFVPPPVDRPKWRTS